MDDETVGTSVFYSLEMATLRVVSENNELTQQKPWYPVHPSFFFPCECKQVANMVYSSLPGIYTARSW